MNNVSSSEHFELDHQLKEIGLSLATYRSKVLKKTRKDFCAMMGVSEPTLRKMERGDQGVSISLWMKAFRIMQVDKSVVAASRPEALILMAMMNSAPGQ